MRRITECQICGSNKLEQVISLGNMPPVNQLIKIDSNDTRTNWLPSDLLHCHECQLVQLGCVADKDVVFPQDYPYTSGTTKLLRDNFEDLARECCNLNLMRHGDLIVDIGSNDGTLLSYFKNQYGMRVCGVEPTDVAKLANDRGIFTEQAFFNRNCAEAILALGGKVKLVTMANCFAHIDDVHGLVENVKHILDDDGVFVTENHYLLPMIKQTQFDAIYHEHLRYYSLASLTRLFAMHDMRVFHVKEIPTHGGSIRVYACRKNASHKFRSSVSALLSEEPSDWTEALDKFSQDTHDCKIDVMAQLFNWKSEGYNIAGISCPSRAATMMNYFGIDEDILDYIVEAPGSLKIDRYAPGTKIPIVDEVRLFTHQPEIAVIFAWHIADELMSKLQKRGYEGQFLRPLPYGRPVKSSVIAVGRPQFA